MSRIIRLEASNVKRLRAVSITPPEHVVKIAGRNGQGKTSVLDSIAYALGGKAEACEEPIRAGEERARIVLETEDLIIRRTFTAKGSELTVQDRRGMKASAPQAILDKLAGKLTFDPMAFLRLEPAKQRDAIMRLLGLDFTEEDRHRKNLYDERTLVNRQVQEATAVLNSMPEYPDAPAEEVSIAGTVAELEAAQTTNRQAKDLQAAAEQARGAVYDAQQEADTVQQTIADTEAEIARLQKRLSDLRQDHTAKLAAVHERQRAAEAAETAAAEAPTVDVAPIRQKLASAELVNSRVRSNAQKVAQRKKVSELSAKADELTAAIRHLDRQKEQKIAAAKFPVEGLSFDDTGLRFRGAPFSQASEAEKRRVSFAMACALNPQLKVALIRDASLLDDESLADVARLAEEHDMQVWLEVVGTADATAVVIEDGAVLKPAANETAEVAP